LDVSRRVPAGSGNLTALASHNAVSFQLRGISSRFRGTPSSKAANGTGGREDRNLRRAPELSKDRMATEIAMQSETFGEIGEKAAASKTDAFKTEVTGSGLAKGVAEDIAHGAPPFVQSPNRGARDGQTDSSSGDVMAALMDFPRQQPVVAVICALLAGVIVGRLFAT
jgi:hypothetical protein